MMSPVVVGVDGSEESLRAVEWAAGEAQRRRQPLQILHAFSSPLVGAALALAPAAPPEDDLWHAAESTMATALARAQAVAPDIEVVTTALPHTEPVPVLLQHSREAELLVVGSRGLGEVASLLLGSVGTRLGTKAACPVVIVRGPVVARGPVVVGIADPGESDDLLAFALAHAARTASPVVLAHVSAEGSAGESSPLPESDLARWRERFPGVRIDQESLIGQPGKTLMHAASRASLLVVGSHHHNEISALIHHSVSQNVLHHASCPVAVIPVQR